jgi:hypothetical protein
LKFCTREKENYFVPKHFIVARVWLQNKIWCSVNCTKDFFVEKRPQTSRKQKVELAVVREHRLLNVENSFGSDL